MRRKLSLREYLDDTASMQLFALRPPPKSVAEKELHALRIADMRRADAAGEETTERESDLCPGLSMSYQGREITFVEFKHKPIPSRVTYFLIHGRAIIIGSSPFARFSHRGQNTMDRVIGWLLTVNHPDNWIYPLDHPGERVG